jgi:DNA-binding transcriptional LysR family regulator
MVRSVYDPVTLDQLRAFVAVVDEGSFSAAARRLRRVQSAISAAMSNLEEQLGVTLWDRSTKIATLTAEGRAVLAGARRVLGEVDELRRLTTGMVMGLEASVSLCIDALFPLAALVQLSVDFAQQFPSVDLRVDTQAMSAVTALVSAGVATIGVANPVGRVPGLEKKPLAVIRMLAVVGPGHPLAKEPGIIPASRLGNVVQIVLSERNVVGGATQGAPDQGVLSPRTWRVADLHTKHALLRANLGWGMLPEHLVRDDLESGTLVRIRPEPWGGNEAGEGRVQLSAIYQTGSAFGPAHRWVLQQLGALCTEEARAAPDRAKSARKRRPARESA